MHTVHVSRLILEIMESMTLECVLLIDSGNTKKYHDCVTEVSATLTEVFCGLTLFRQVNSAEVVCTYFWLTTAAELSKPI
jgi:hypothetical protein